MTYIIEHSHRHDVSVSDTLVCYRIPIGTIHTRIAAHDNALL
jgi:anti-sigma regulatory factor (Ser/Thr protein kinase)